MKTRQSFNKDFKAKVVLEALREELTLQEITTKYGASDYRVENSLI